MAHVAARDFCVSFCVGGFHIRAEHICIKTLIVAVHMEWYNVFLGNVHLITENILYCMHMYSIAISADLKHDIYLHERMTNVLIAIRCRYI